MADEIKNSIEAEDIEWEMDWSRRKEDGTRAYPDKPEKEMMFEEPMALAHLLMNEVVFINNNWWREDWKEHDREKISVHVNCNDVFAWGCSDSETLPYKEIEIVYRFWQKDPCWGPTIWCLIQRKELPQEPVAKSIRQQGIWDLAALAKEHGLRPNHYDGICGVLAKRKYDLYSAWQRMLNKVPHVWDAGWWHGWKEYEEAHPGLYNEEWKAEDSRLCQEWRVANGFKELDE